MSARERLRAHVAEVQRMYRVARGEEHPDDVFDLVNCMLMRPDVIDRVLDRVSSQVMAHLSTTRRDAEAARARFMENVRR